MVPKNTTGKLSRIFKCIQVSNLHHIYFEASVLVIILSIPNHGSLCPWSSFFCCTATVDHVCREREFFCKYLPLCLFGIVFLYNIEWLLSSLLHPVGCLLNLNSMPLDVLLNRRMARHGHPGLISVNPICNKKGIYQHMFQSIPSWLSWQILCLLLLVHYSDGCKMIILNDRCWVAHISLK